MEFFNFDLSDILSKKKLPKIQLQNADLEGGRFSGAILDEANLSGANLLYTRFDDASLKNAIMMNTKIRNTNFQNADLRGALGLSSEMLCNASNLCDVKLDETLAIACKKKCPEKFKSISAKKANKANSADAKSSAAD